MPRNDADSIRTGSGQANEGSVTATSLTFFVHAGGDGPIWAEDVNTHRYPGSLDRNAQGNLEELAGLLPELPNRIGETRNAKNPSTLSFSPHDPVEALYWNGSSNQTVYGIDATNFEISALIFPADRGVLAVRRDGSHDLAIDLQEVFVEDSLFSDSAPSRPIGQNPYTAGADPDATVQDPGGSNIPQNVDLARRLPVLTDYTAANFPFLSSPPDPVYNDTYTEDLPAYQLALATMTVVLNSDGNVGNIDVVHYESAEDLVNQQQGDPYEVYNEFDLAGYIDNANQGIDFFRDTDGTSITFNSFTLTADDTFDTTESPRRRVSGITYYGPNDGYDASFTADGLYTQSFLEEGARVAQIHPSTAAGAIDLNYNTYSPNGTQPGSEADYADTSLTWSMDYMSQRTPGIWLSDPYGETAMQTTSDAFLWNAHSDFGSVPMSRHQLETFYDEETRYPDSASPSDNILPDGSGSGWDPTTQLTDFDLQVRGVTTEEAPEVAEGGELAAPTTDYSTGHVPTTRNGTDPQYDYSGLPTTNDREYIRSFDVEGPELEGIIEIKGSSGQDLIALTDYEEGGAFGGHPGGWSLWVAPAGVDNQQWLDLGREWEDNHGALVSRTQVDAHTYQFKYRLDRYPESESGFYPVAFRIVLHSDGSNYDPTALQYQFYSVEWKSAQ